MYPYYFMFIVYLMKIVTAIVSKNHTTFNLYFVSCDTVFLNPISASIISLRK